MDILQCITNYPEKRRNTLFFISLDNVVCVGWQGQVKHGNTQGKVAILSEVSVATLNHAEPLAKRPGLLFHSKEHSHVLAQSDLRSEY